MNESSISCLHCREGVEERRKREAMRHDALKRRRVEVLDVNYNDKVQREADMKPSVNVASSAEGGEMDDVDSGRLCFLLF